MEMWSFVDEADSPFGLAVGERMTWNGLTIERQQVLGPNWNYTVIDLGTPYSINVFPLRKDRYRTRIQGAWYGNELDTYIQEEVGAISPEEAFVETLMLVISLRPAGH